MITEAVAPFRALYQRHVERCRGEFRRLYVRHTTPSTEFGKRGKARWVAVGWHCETCGNVILDKELEP